MCAHLLIVLKKELLKETSTQGVSPNKELDFRRVWYKLMK